MVQDASPTAAAAAPAPVEVVQQVISRVQVSWSGFVVTLIILVALLFLRRLLPPDRRKRGRSALALLALSLIARLAAGGAGLLGYDTGMSMLGFVAALLMAFGITGVIALLVFDILLARAQVQVAELVRDILQAVAFAVIIIAVLQAQGVNLVGLITTSAVLTAIIGLALQSTLSNMFAGLTLQMDRSIGAGDWVKVNEKIGRVLEIKWRSTLLVTRGGDLVIVPNSTLLGQDVTNFSRPTPEHRVTLRIGFGYQHPPNEVKSMLLDCVRGVPGIAAEPAPDAFPADFGDSAVVYSLRYWITDMQREIPVEGEVRTRVWYAARRAGIEIPFPIRTLYMNQVTDERTAQEREREVVDRTRALEETELFRGLEPADLKLVAGAMKTVRFSAGEQVIRQGDPGDSMYVIRSGEVTVRLAVDGAEREVATLGTGKFFGEMSLMTGEPRRATCAAKGDTVCYVVDKQSFHRVLELKPRIVEEISTVLGERQSALEGQRENLGAEARARRAAENSSRLMRRIRDFFNLG
jgi:small-conductance mechanosensitive channel/CRP-like cAMP-binding protein